MIKNGTDYWEIIKRSFCMVLTILFFSSMNSFAQDVEMTITGNTSTGDTLNYSNILYDFEGGSQGWTKDGSNLDAVYSTSTGEAITSYNGDYLFYETNSTNAPQDFRAAKVETDGLDLTNYKLVGAARTWGISSTNNFIVKVKLWGPTEADTISAVDTIHADDWYFFSLDLGNWKYANNVTKIWIGIANRDTPLHYHPYG
ncbi:MAG: hypothetical protein PVH88_00140 [Ignavibacteria bacterium]